MHNRRDFLTLSAAGMSLPLNGCADGDMDAYNQEAAQQRRPPPTPPDLSDLIRYATLAANGHNTQPWLFQPTATGITILPDFKRTTRAVDPDDHHLYVSLGCAAENLLIAGEAGGRPGSLQFVAAGEGQLQIALDKSAARPGDLYAAIPKRQSTRSVYDGRMVPAEHLRLLEKAAEVDGVTTRLFVAPEECEDILDFVVAGNSAQMDDPDFVQELLDWIRFNPDEAMRSGDGLFTAASGNPTLPTWIGTRLFGWFFEKETENAKYVEHVRSSAGVAVFTGDRDDKESWVKVGRAFQRFALQATALGIRHAHINQPVEVPEVRREFGDWLGSPQSRPDLIIRFGYAPPLPMSLRRPVELVTIPAAS